MLARRSNHLLSHPTFLLAISLCSVHNLVYSLQDHLHPSVFLTREMQYRSHFASIREAGLTTIDF